MNTLAIILLQIITLLRPEAIVATADAPVVAVELRSEATLVRIGRDSLQTVPWQVPPTAFLSDEADVHHKLLSSTSDAEGCVMLFEPLPPTTRVFDLVADASHRWLGIHSSMRRITFPATRAKYDKDAKIAHSIDSVIRQNSLQELLDDAGFYERVKSRLPLLRDYIAWKWRLSAHEVFVLAKAHQRDGAASALPTAVGGPTVRSLDALPEAPKASRRQRQREERARRQRANPPPSAAVKPRKVRSLSRFEQKMLQEMRR